MSDFDKKQQYFESKLRDLINLLPSSYNKEVSDVNYYKLLRALAFELADAEFEVERVRNNIYLKTVSPEAIFPNFGTLIRLEKRHDWSDEKYRGLVEGVTQSLLKGPTKQSMLDGLKLFTNFNSNIYELYKDADKVDPLVYQGYNPKFTFVLEVEKPLDEYVDQTSLSRDVAYIINIIKPAHTIGIIVIMLVGEENFKHYYSVERRISNIIKRCSENKILKRLNVLIEEEFENAAQAYAYVNLVTLEEAREQLRINSNGMSSREYLNKLNELTDKKYQEYLQSVNSKPCGIATFDRDFFIEEAKKDLRGTLENQYYNSIREEAYFAEIAELIKSQVEARIEAKKQSLIHICDVLDPDCDPEDFTPEEWTEKALNVLKDEALRNKLINDLGGIDKIREECSIKAEEFRGIFENHYENETPYCGMDQFTMDLNVNSNEGIYGWKHFTYPGQLKTSTSFNHSKIGGAQLIGPRYTLYDRSQFNFEIEFEEFTDFLKSYRFFQLNNDRLNQLIPIVVSPDKAEEFEIYWTGENVDFVENTMDEHYQEIEFLPQENVNIPLTVEEEIHTITDVNFQEETNDIKEKLENVQYDGHEDAFHRVSSSSTFTHTANFTETSFRIKEDNSERLSDTSSYLFDNNNEENAKEVFLRTVPSIILNQSQLNKSAFLGIIPDDCTANLDLNENYRENVLTSDKINEINSVTLEEYKLVDGVWNLTNSRTA